MPEPRRIGYLSGALRVSTRADAEASGPRAHVVGFTGALERRGWEVRRFVVGDTKPALALAPSGRAETVRGSRSKQLATDALRMASGVQNRRRAWRQLRGQVDLVYERFASFQALGAPFRRHDVPWILETQGPYFHEANHERGSLALTGRAQRIELDAYRSCDLLVCVSAALRELLVDFGVSHDRILVLRNGVDPHSFAIDPGAPALEDVLTVGFVGTLRRWQGVDALVEAVAGARRGGVPVQAVIVGDGPELEPLRRLASERELGEQVRFTGRVSAEAVPSLIAGFDLGFSGHLPLLAGRMYHSPLKLYEYLAMGKPLLAADHPEARGLVEESGAGYLFPPGDAEALAEVLAVAAGDLRRLRDRGPAMRCYAVAHHTWDGRVRELAAELERRGL
jgi:glycosyltransferase involved in cell wall biosynthesis